MADLIPYRRVHIVGAGGTGMSGLGKLLSQCGHIVTGSDLKPGPMLMALRGSGVETWVGHRPETVAQADLVVASSAVPDRDPELAAARDAGVEIWHRPQLLAAITNRLRSLGVTGTHGKTTGSAMTVMALRAVGQDPSFMVGGRIIDLNTNAHLGDEDLFVLEADEAYGTFLNLRLSALLITNIEADHLDHYGSVENMERAYAEVAAGVDGPVVACIDDAGVRRLAAAHEGLVGYGTTEGSAWQIVAPQRRNGGVNFTLRGHDDVEVFVPKPGDHVARNAAGVIALCAELGYDPAQIAAGLSGFTGVRRRFEVRSRRAGVVLVDDYAHHPTEVAATIDAARQGHDGRIMAVFQPHRFTRTQEHGAALGEALSAADVIFVNDVYAAGEAPIPGVSGRAVADAVARSDVTYVPRRVDIAAAVAERVEPGDLVLLLGAGDITQVADELAPLLPEA